MIVGLLGRKLGMTRVFTEDGVSVPVSVVEAKNNRIVQVKSLETDAYISVQVAVGERKAKHVTKGVAGHYAKNNIELGRRLREFRLKPDHGLEVGHVLTVDQFQVGQIVDVTGTTKGKGFAGAVKRHNFSMQDATHGNSLSHRAPGSSGQNQSPGRVFKGKRMSGHMGDVRATVQNLEVIKVDVARELLLIKGAIPGAPGGEVVVKLAVKTRIRPDVAA